jgi:hypothetical protein
MRRAIMVGVDWDARWLPQASLEDWVVRRCDCAVCG